MKIIMTGGGTGGHIYPAIAIADEIISRRPDADILFLGTEKGLEKTLVPENGYPIKFIKASGLNRKKLLRNIKVLSEVLGGISEAKAILKVFKPDIVIGTGGYVCGPVALAAKKMGARVFIHEQNAFPGITNKLLAKHAEKIFLGFEEASGSFKEKSKLVYSGNPVRKDFFGSDREKAREALGISRESFMILSFGGSQGAERINSVMTEVSTVFSGLSGIFVIFVTGKKHYEKVSDSLRGIKTASSGNIQVLPYMDAAALYLSACDIVISRAGAITVSEISVCGKPAILIPSPNVTGNHQFFNAKVLADRGGAVLIEEKDLNAENLIDILLKMKNDRAILDKMAEVNKKVMESRAVDAICENIGI